MIRIAPHDPLKAPSHLSVCRSAAAVTIRDVQLRHTAAGRHVSASTAPRPRATMNTHGAVCRNIRNRGWAVVMAGRCHERFSEALAAAPFRGCSCCGARAEITGGPASRDRVAGHTRTSETRETGGTDGPQKHARQATQTDLGATRDR